MRSFYEMMRLMEQQPVQQQQQVPQQQNQQFQQQSATAPQNPNMQQNKMPNPAQVQNNQVPNQPKATDENNPEVQRFVDELTKMLDDGTDLGNFQSQLKRYINNPSFFEAVTKTGPEDRLAVANSPINVSLLVPTQKEVFLENSVDAGIENRFGNAPKIIAGSDPAAAGSVVVAQVGGQYHIIDGHHRWSQFVCFNPKSQIQCKIVSGMQSALKGLKVTHLAVAIEKKSVPSESGNPRSNLLEMSKEQVAEYVKNKIGNNQTKPKIDEKTGNPITQSGPILEMFRQNIPEQNLPNARNASVDDVANYIGNNSQLVKKKAGEATQANPREIMPQTGGTNFDKTIGSGSVNVSPQDKNTPALAQGQQLQAAHTRHQGPSLNEWLVLSGIIKD